MNRQSWLLNLSLLHTHPAFRALFFARFISIVSLGLLGVAVLVQIQAMTQSTWLVGLAVTLTGCTMFIGLMAGGVLADRFECKKLILISRGTCGIGFIGLGLNAQLPEPSLLAIYLLGIWDGFFPSHGVTALLAATPAIVGRENLMQAGVITMLTVRLGSVISPMPGGLLLASGNLARHSRPGLVMLLATMGSFLTIGLFGLMPVWVLGVFCLALFGWLSAVSSLLQYTMRQTQTPEAMLGRINGLWTAQNVTDDAIGAAVLTR